MREGIGLRSLRRPHIQRLLACLVVGLFVGLTACLLGVAPGTVVCAQAAPPDQPSPLILTPEERAWIANTPSIPIGVVADDPPFSFFRDDAYLGFSIELIHHIETLTGLHFDLRMGNWGEIYNQFLDGNLLAIDAISYTKNRASLMLFTEPYYARRTVVFHNLEHPLSKTETGLDLTGRRIGIIRDIYYQDALKAQGLTLVPYETYRDLVAALAFGWVDAALAPDLTGHFFSRASGFSTVALAGPPPVRGIQIEDFRYGVSRKLPILRSILNKALASIPDADLDAMIAHWRTYRPGLTLAQGPLRLLPQERAFIDTAPPLKVGFMSDFQPFSSLTDGTAQGFAVDLVREIADRTGLVLSPVFDTWPRLLESLRDGSLDAIANVSFTEARTDYILFTQPYYQEADAVFVHRGFGAYTNVSDLKGKRIGITRDVFFQEPLTERVGADSIVLFADQSAMLRALNDGQLDAVVTTLSHGTAMIRRLGLTMIEIGGVLSLDTEVTEDLRFGVAANRPLLRGILNRAMGSLPPARWEELETRWLGPRLASRVSETVPMPPDERTWLDQHGVLRVCGGMTKAPYEVIGHDGRYQGVAGDVMEMLSHRGGFTWELVPADSRAEALDNARAGRCDLMPFVMETLPELPDWTTTNPYLRMPAVVATLLDHPFLQGMASLAGESVGIVRTSPLRILLNQRYPTIHFVPVDTEYEGIRLLREGSLDATIGSLPRLGTLLTHERITDIKIAGNVPDMHRVRMAYPANTPVLGSVLTRLIGALGDSEVQASLNRWISIRYDRTVDARVVWSIIAGATILILLFVVWNRKLSRLNARLNEANQRLHELSVTDSLTRLPNRGYMESRLTETFAVCQRNALAFSIAMIDVDHFKEVNDQMGHAFGDACLRQIAEILDVHFRRDGDVVARFGGEEFVTFTSGVSAQAFPHYLDALRKRIAAHTVVYADMQRSVTISIGCYTATPKHGETVHGYLEIADRNLYKAKDAGRNQIISTHAEQTARSPKAASPDHPPPAGPHPAGPHPEGPHPDSPANQKPSGMR